MKKLLVFIIIFLAALLIVRGFWNSQLEPVSKGDESQKTFIIAKGQGFSQTAEKLQKEGLIKSSFALKLLAKQKGLDSKVQSGTFELSPSMSGEEVLKILTEQPLEVWVTLLEGWRIEEMAEEINGKLKIDNGEFLKVAKEGYMFPDTYLIPHDYTVKQIAQMMRDNFDNKYSEELKNKIKKQGLTEEEGVILASLVEREARSDKARTEVASILLKRLNIDMGLNADATIQYALGDRPNEKSWWKRHLSRDDLKIESPYNTYLYRGLPPTPICNPSLSSLQAVANADSKTPYLYYYHDSKGNSYYGKTLEEHNENVANNP